MNKKYLYIAGGVIASLLLLRACVCDDNGTASAQMPVVVQPSPQAQQPVIFQSQPLQPVIVHDSDSGGFSSGLLLGHMIGGSHRYYSHTTVVRRYSTPRYYRSRTVKTYRAPRNYYGRRH